MRARLRRIKSRSKYVTLMDIIDRVFKRHSDAIADNVASNNVLYNKLKSGSKSTVTTQQYVGLDAIIFNDRPLPKNTGATYNFTVTKVWDGEHD